MNIDELMQKKFKTFMVSIEAGELLFRHNDVDKIINEIERLNGVILGLDFWKRCDDGNIMEINSTAWEHINQGVNAPKNTIEAARELLKDRLPDNADYVSFILKDQEVDA